MSVILAEGLNPYLGNLHRSERKELHLAFDLMEEWRSTFSRIWGRNPARLTGSALLPCFSDLRHHSDE
jgi:CRISPR associated protein Cas1